MDSSPGGGSPWRPSLYTGSAEHYARGRVPYPASLATALRDALGLDGTGRLLDVGCGPGSLTLLLAPLFAATTGVDADSGMIAVASSREPAVEWRVLRAEELPADLGTYRVVTFAQSFHWMDRPTVAAAVRGMLDPGGTLVHVGANTHAGIGPGGRHPRPPHEAMGALVRRYVTPPPGGTASGEDDIFRAAGFTGPERIELPDRVVERSADEVVAGVFSLSTSTPRLLGDRRAAFESDLRALLRSASPDGVFSELMRGITLSLWR